MSSTPSSAAFEIAGLRVSPGTRESGWLQVARAPDGGSFGIPVVVLHGKTNGPVLVVDAGTHGYEFEGTLSLLTLLRATDPTTLRGTIVGIPVLNTSSFEAETRGNPLERHHYDMNRVFPGDAGGTITQRIAARYFSEIVKRASILVSLHGGGSSFYLDGFVIAHSVTGDNLDLIKAWGWRRFTDTPDVAANPYQGTLYEKAAAVGVPSITVELGGSSHRLPQHLKWMKQEYLRGLRNIMIHFGMVDGRPDRPPTLWRIKKQNIRLNHGGIIDLDEGIDIEAAVKKGQRLLTVYDPLGSKLEEILAPFEGRVMALPASPMAYPGRIVSSVYQVLEEIPF
jgi:predicted deacylase